MPSQTPHILPGQPGTVQARRRWICALARHPTFHRSHQRCPGAGAAHVNKPPDVWLAPKWHSKKPRIFSFKATRCPYGKICRSYGWSSAMRTTLIPCSAIRNMEYVSKNTQDKTPKSANSTFQCREKSVRRSSTRIFPQECAPWRQIAQFQWHLESGTGHAAPREPTWTAVVCLPGLQMHNPGLGMFVVTILKHINIQIFELLLYMRRNEH